MTVSTPAHRMFDVVRPQERGQISACVLGPLIGVDQDGALWLSPPNGREQGLKY